MNLDSLTSKELYKMTPNPLKGTLNNPETLL